MIDEGLLERARVLITQERYDEAQKIIGELMGMAPNNDYLLYLLSEIHLQKENYTRAEELIDSAIALSPQESEYFYFKARLYLLKENKEEAEHYIREAITMYPHEAGYFAFWAHVELLKKDYEYALNIANQALALDSSNILIQLPKLCMKNLITLTLMPIMDGGFWKGEMLTVLWAIFQNL